MGSGTAPPALPPAEPQPPPQAADCEAMIDQRLRQTRRRVKGVDLAAGLIWLGIGGLGCLLLVAIVDHWIVPTGLGFWGRTILFAGLVAAASVHFLRHVLPLLIHRINPVFAAQAIEQGYPSMKNSLVNLLFLRRDLRQFERSEIAKRIYVGLQHKTAADLAEIPVEQSVDRARVIRLGCVLTGLLVICAVYLMISPKDPLVSFGRVLMPWADIKAPTRVTIEDVEPGDG
ncbi:unnamed protein product, partial [marine sediment metagenome]